MRTIIPLNFRWEFTEEYDDAFCCGEGQGKIVDIPHTCRQTPFNYFDESIYQMRCAYRKKIRIPESAEGKRVFIIVEGAAHKSRVYVNGIPCGEEHLCGYTAYEREITDHVSPGESVLVTIETDCRETLNIPPFGHVVDYMTYGGLYREVRLEIREKSYISSVFAKPEISGRLVTEVAVEGACERIYQKLYSGDELICEKSFSPGEVCELMVSNVRLWSCAFPFLYRLETSLVSYGNISDSVTVSIGFRSAVFKEDGFYLNGKKFRLIGLNRHQSFPYVGYAMPASMQRLDAEILKKELCVNAVRTSHYPQSQHFIDRCDELGLLVFTEIPGWQHIGDEQWKQVSIDTVREMVTQYRNHPSVILWGVRINESPDDDDFYRRTNDAAHILDPTRQTSGVRCHKKSSLLEDVYAYNDFLHDGTNAGCEPKKSVTSDMSRGYLVSEYNGHMFPTKTYDDEEHRLEHALRHARVLDSIWKNKDIAGSFGWCFTDYNTHKDFGSGDRICYHGVCDMFRNKKLAADVYASFSGFVPVLNVSSSMDIGEHPSGYRGRVYAFTNADSLRVYHNDVFLREYTRNDSKYRHLPHPPLEIVDYIGEKINENEDFTPKQAEYIRDVLNSLARFGMNNMSVSEKSKILWLMTRYGMTFSQAYALYGKYIGNWGGEASVFRFEAVKNGKVVSTVIKEPFRKLKLSAEANTDTLTEADTYDVASVRIRMTDQNGNTLPFFNGTVSVSLSGPAEIIGEVPAILRGGCGGLYIRTTGKSGDIVLTLSAPGAEDVTLRFAAAKEKEAYND